MAIPATASEFDTPEFLAELRRGDERAYRRLMRRFHGSLVGVAASIIGSRAQAEEVVQDAWLAVFLHVGTFEGRSSLAGWLFTIVMNRARSRITRESRMVALPAVLDGVGGDDPVVPKNQFLADGHWVDPPTLWNELDPERVIGGRQLWDHVQAVIETLPAGQKAVVILRDIEDRTAEEACALLQISPENQRVLLHRGRGRIRAVLDALTGTPADGRQSHARPAPGRPSGAIRRFTAAALAWLFPPVPVAS
ncbi:MAG: RNA polymerase sigma factor [Alphaproteobacteria bacterium]|nr:RNA polymerase sigma factor [Alphaproteobacteria bacterium]